MDRSRDSVKGGQKESVKKKLEVLCWMCKGKKKYFSDHRWRYYYFNRPHNRIQCLLIFNLG
jgi:hypothetical protein